MARKFSNNKEISQLVVKALESGAWVYEDGKKHGKLLHKATLMVLAVSKSPSCMRASLNLKSEIRQIEAGTHKILSALSKK